MPSFQPQAIFGPQATQKLAVPDFQGDSATTYWQKKFSLVVRYKYQELQRKELTIISYSFPHSK